MTFQKGSDGLFRLQDANGNIREPITKDANGNDIAANLKFNGFGQMTNVKATDAQKQETKKLVEQVKTP